MQSVAPPVPNELFRAIRKISSLFEILMIEIVKQKGKRAMSITRIADTFFRRCGILSKDWAFSDILFIRFFERVSKEYLVGKAFLLHASCFITSLCLNDSSDVIKMIIGVYSAPLDKSKISLEKCEHLFKNILLHSAAKTQSGVIQRFNQLEEYIDGSPLVWKVFETEDGSSEMTYIPTQSMERFCNGAHPSLLWPVLMLQRQLQKFFFGSKLWEKIRRSDFCQFIKERGVMSDAFLFSDFMSKVYTSNMSNPEFCELVSQGKDLNGHHTTLAYDLYVARKSRVAFSRPRRSRRSSRSFSEYDEDRRQPSGSMSPVLFRHDLDVISDAHRVKFSPDNSPSSSPQTSPTNSPPTSPMASPHTSPPSSDDEDDDRKERSSTLTMEAVTTSNTEGFQNFIDPFTGEIKYLRVLVIEDSQFQRKLIVRRLMKCFGEELTDYEDRWPVVSVQSGEAALSIIEREIASPYNVFIVDENLDGGGGVMKGHEVIKSIRRNPHLKNAIIIGCTANIARHGQNFLDAGADAVWAKPIPDPAILQRNIKELLMSSVSRRSNKEKAPVPI